MMATALQKNTLKPLPNGNGLVHQTINGFEGTEEEEAVTGGTSDQSAPEAEAIIEEPEIDIMINNVVCSFSVRCHLNLREIALNG